MTFVVNGRPYRRATLALLTVLSACGGGGDDFPPIQWHSAHFQYGARADDPYPSCADALDTLEEHWRFWRGELHLPDPGPGSVTYLKFRDDADLLNGHCPPGAAACTTGTSVRTTTVFDKHELIHAYLAETMPPPVPLFAEGAAVAFSCDAGAFGLPATLPDWRVFLDPPADSTDWIALYPLGGKLVSYVYSQFGADAFIRFYDRIGPVTGADAIADQFLADFGITLDEAWAAATSGAPICLSLWECSRPEIALDGAPHAATQVCGRDLVPRTLHMPAAGNVKATVRGAASNFNLAPACGNSTAPARQLSLWPGGDFSLLGELPAGTYLVIGDGEVSATAADARSIGSTCADLVPHSVQPVPSRFFITAPGSTAYARLRFDQTRAVVIANNGEGSSGPGVWTCPDCATDSSTCPQANLGTTLRATVEGEFTWVMRGNGPGWITFLLHDPP